MKNFKKIKAMRNIAGIIALMAVIVFMAAGCKNNPEDNPVTTVHNLIATAEDGNGNKQVLNFNITGTNRTVRAINITGASTYEVLLAGTVISAGAVTVSGIEYTFTPNGGGSPFKLNANTGALTGSITVSAAAKKEIVDNSGFELTLPDPFTLTLATIMEAKTPGSYWDGTWIRVDEERKSLTDLNQRIVFSGNTYTLYTGTGSETGTFMFTENVGGTENYDNTFIFFRKGQGTTTEAYLWEGQNKAADGNPAFLELYNHFYDSMEIAIDSNGGPGVPAGFLKQ